MRNRIIFGISAVMFTLSAGVPAWAGGQRGQQAGQQHQMDQDRDRAHSYDKEHLEARDQDRARVHQDLAPIYGEEVMSQQERLKYQEQLRAQHTGQEREQFMAEHRNQMQQRAAQRGVTLEEPIYGQNVMSQEERLRYREQLQTMQTEQEREQFMAEHRTKMQSRAQQQTLQPDDVEEAE